jgi:hypothetical protein
VNNIAGRTFNWFYNDQLQSNETTHTYTTRTPGIYKAVVQGNGCIDSTTIEVASNSTVSTGFTVNDSIQCFFSHNFAFTDTSKYPGTYTRQWSFGDNTVSTQPFVNKKYLVASKFRVRLLTVTPAGCRDSAIQYITNFQSANSKITYVGVAPEICTFDSIRLNAPTGAGIRYQWYYNGLALQDDTTAGIWTTHPGSYKVRVTNANGCDSLSAPVVIKGKKLPMRPTVTQTGFTLTSSPAAAYQWLLGSVPVAGETQQFFTPTTAGYYSVRIDSSNGCKSTSWETYMSSTTSVGETVNGETFHVYPNPASSNLTMESAAPFAWKLLDITGRVVAADESMQQHHHADLSMLRNGIYLLHLSSANGMFVKRIEKL